MAAASAEIRMIVCSCNVIRESQIREVARQGVVDVEDVYAQLGCEPNCCQCLPFAAQIIEEEARVPA
jgi:bacterioferritin-associated ferredoxin